MRKSLLVLFVMVLFTSVGFSQNMALRKAEYRQLLSQRQELLSWSKENPLAPRFMGIIKEKEARKIRTQLYTDFFDFRQKEVSAFKQDLRREIQKAANAPFITFNTLPAKNLQKLARRPEFLVEFLSLYPDNVVMLSDAFLTKLFKQNEKLENLVASYFLYLKSYNTDSSCVKFSEGEERQLKGFYKSGNMERFYKSLSLYAASNLTAKKQALARNYVKKSLACSFTF